MTLQLSWLVILTAVVALMVVGTVVRGIRRSREATLNLADTFDKADSAGMLVYRKRYRDEIGEVAYARWEQRVATLRARRSATRGATPGKP
jgi:hypothetical protein